MKTKIVVASAVLALHTHAFGFDKSDELLKAIETDNVILVNRLVRYGADPNMDIKKHDTTPLFHAVATSSPKVVEDLIKFGSEVDIADSSGTTPLIYSIKTNKKKIASLLIKKSRNINMKDKNGLTALHYAAKKGNEDIFAQIMSKGANVSAVDKSGNNVLLHAMEGRNKRIINNLIDSQKIDLAHKNNSGETAQKVALRNGMPEIAKRVSRGRN